MGHIISRLKDKEKSIRARRSAKVKFDALCGRFEDIGALSDLEGVISQLRQAVLLTPDSHPDKPMYLNYLGFSLSSQFEHTGMLSDLEGAIENERQAVSLTPSSHPAKAVRLDNLGSSLSGRFQRTGMLSDLEEAIENLQQAVSLTPGDHPSKARRLNNLGSYLESRFQRTGVLSDLEEAIENQRQAMSLTPDGHPDKPLYFNNLGNSLESRSQRTGMLSDLEEAIGNQQQAVSLTPSDHPAKAGRLNNLGFSLWRRFEHTGTLGDLEDAIENQQQVVSLTPDGHLAKPLYFNNLGNYLSNRYELTGTLSDLEEAIENQQQVVSLTSNGDPRKPLYFNNLGKFLSSRFQCTGMLGDLEDAIENQQQAVFLAPDGHPDKPLYFTNLGNSLSRRFECKGILSDLKEAIRNQQQAVSLTPDGRPNKPLYFNNLGGSLSSRFEHTGILSDLEDAIENQQQAVSLTPDSYPRKPLYFNNLGNFLSRRFEHTGMLSDLEEAIENQQQAVSLTPDGHPDKILYFNNLGNSLSRRFQRTGILNDLEQAIENQQQAVSLTPHGHPDKPLYFNNLGIYLRRRFKHTQILNDLEAAIENLQQAVSLTPGGHPAKAGRLHNLGSSLSSQFEQTGVLSNLDEAIENLQQAVSLTPDGHPDKPLYFNNLGFSLQIRFQRTGILSDLEDTISNFRLAATSSIGPVLLRCHTSQQWARLEAHRNSSSALVAYCRAITLLPQVAWIGDPITTRHSQLTDLDDLSREAAAFALDVGRPDLALEWLEQGRSVVWNQLIHLRTSVEPLRRTHPDIYAEFTQVSHELQMAATRGYTMNPDTEVRDAISREEETRRHHRLAEKWDLLVQEIRSLPKFQDFLLPKKVSTLMEAASEGPVVVINVHKRRCDALVLDQGRDQVLHIPLNKLHYGDLTRMHKSMHLYLANAYRAQRWEDHTGGTIQPVGSSPMVNILKKLYVTVVYPILQALDMTTARSKSSYLPRLWWCPTGPLTFYPLHAACVTTKIKIDGTFNYVISSYTPTVNALLEARSAKARPFSQLVGIAMAHTPGQISLPGVETEIVKIQELFTTDSRWSFEILRNEQATRERVLTHMANSSWVHLVCHAVQDKREPTQSGFCFHDGRLTIMDIVAKPFDYADLAFLSACQTATGDENASDEAVHITGAMLGAGYRGVIGTMWSIPDEAASVVATKVYEVLLSGGEPDCRQAAQALHDAVREMRESDHNSYTFWVPFVHYGV